MPVVYTLYGIALSRAKGKVQPNRSSGSTNINLILLGYCADVPLSLGRYFAPRPPSRLIILCNSIVVLPLRPLHDDVPQC
jgi:hypothetical protein